MRKFLMGLIAALIAITVSLGMMPAASATGSSDGTTELEVSSWSLGAASSDAEITNETRLVIDGATQVSWEVPDHNVKVTKKQLRKAPRIKVNATGANSSKVIFKAAVKKLSKKMSKKEAIKAAGIVVLKKGSCVRNTGRENRLRVGFVWCLAYDAVLVFDKPSKQYRHAYNIRDGKLIKTCLNYIGGNVPMRKKVVQVRYEEDIQYGANIAATAEAKVSVKFALTCPNGASFEVDGWAKAYGYARSYVTFTQRIRASVVGDFKLKAEQNISVNQDVLAAAGAGINIKATCGDNPPPPPPPPPADNLPSMQCHAAQHIWVGEDPMVAVFDLTDPDGTPVSFDSLEVSGPIEIVLTEDSTIADGKRRTLTIRAAHIPEGTEQPYSLKLFGSSGGKQTSCLAQGTVKNNDTGWEA